jgi:hypothetical protein
VAHDVSNGPHNLEGMLAADGPSSSSSNPIAQGLSRWSTGLETGGFIHSLGVRSLGASHQLEEAPAAFDPANHSRGKTIIRLIEDAQLTSDDPIRGQGLGLICATTCRGENA